MTNHSNCAIIYTERKKEIKQRKRVNRMYYYNIEITENENTRIEAITRRTFVHWNRIREEYEALNPNATVVVEMAMSPMDEELWHECLNSRRD